MLTLECLEARETPSAGQDEDPFKFKLLAIEQQQAVAMAVVPVPLVVVGTVPAAQAPGTTPAPATVNP